MKILKRLMPIFLAILFLVGCSADPTDQALEQITQALQLNQSLEQADFHKAVAYDGQVMSEVTGGFVKNGDTYDWYTADHDAQGNVMQETVSKDGQMHKRVARPDNPDFVEWEMVSVPRNVQELIAPLLNESADLKPSWIEGIETSQKEEGTEITLHMGESYVAELKEQSLADLEANLEELDKVNDTTGQKEAIQMQIQMIEEQAYKDPKISLIIDEAGYLISFNQNYALQIPGQEWISVETVTELTAYNQDDPYHMFPEIDG